MDYSKIICGRSARPCTSVVFNTTELIGAVVPLPLTLSLIDDVALPVKAVFVYGVAAAPRLVMLLMSVLAFFPLQVH